MFLRMFRRAWRIWRRPERRDLKLRAMRSRHPRPPQPSPEERTLSALMAKTRDQLAELMKADRQ